MTTFANVDDLFLKFISSVGKLTLLFENVRRKLLTKEISN